MTTATKTKLFPSYEEQATPQDRILLNPKTRRIRWTLDGPLETAVSVARDWYLDPDEVPEPYHPGHPFAQAPLTKPKVSSLKLDVDPLDHWDYFWMEIHDRHMFPDEACLYDPTDVLYGLLPGGAATENGEEDLLVCCGEKRPWGQAADLVVEATGDFVTIHDFISAVHPYLMARRDDVLEAMNLDQGRTRKPFLPETKLMVEWQGAKGVDVENEAEWLAQHTPRDRRLKPDFNSLPPHIKKVTRYAQDNRRVTVKPKTLSELWGPDDE